MLIKSWLRSFTARVQSGSVRRRYRRLSEQAQQRSQVRVAESLEERMLLTALVFDSETPGPITVTNADMAGFDAIVIHSATIDSNFGNGITIDLDNIPLEYIAIENVNIVGNVGTGISIDLENVTGLDDVTINTANINSNSDGAVDIDIDGIEMDDLSIAQSTIEGATHINVTGSTLNRLASSDNVLTHTDASWDVTLDSTTVESVTVADSDVSGGVSIVGSNTVDINSGYIVRNGIQGDVGDEGVLLQLADSTVSDFFIADNSEISSLTEDGVLLDLDNTPGDGIRIMDNTFSTDASVAIDFLIDGDTFTQPFTLRNESASDQLITRVTLDISPTNLQFDVDPDTGRPFTPLNGTDGTTGLNPNILLTDTILEMEFSDFLPLEEFLWNLDVDFIGDPGDLSPVFGNDLIGSLMTIEFTDSSTLDSREVTGLLVGAESRDAATFASASGGSGGYGVRLDLTDSPIDGILIDENQIEGNSAGGVLFNNFNSDVVDAYMSRNEINATQLSGVEYRLVDSNFSGGMFDNLIGGHRDHGVLVDPSVDISGVVEDASNDTNIEITSIAHGLVTGDTVAVSAVDGNIKANGVYTVTVVDANRFLLNGADGSNIGVDTDRHTGGGVWFKAPRGGNITNATNDANDVVITSVGHGLATGDVITINDVFGNLIANGTHTVTVIDGDTFALDGVAGSGDYEPGTMTQTGGMWFEGYVVDFQSTVNRRFKDNNFNSNTLAGVRINLPQGTVFNADFEGNTFDANQDIGLHTRATAGTFDLDIGNANQDVVGLPVDRNTFSRNIAAGIGLEVLDSSTGSFEIRQNAFIAQENDPDSARFNGDGINIRMEGTLGATTATSSLVTSIIDGNVYGVDSRGNQGSGLDFFMQEETKLQILEVTNNTFLNNFDDGFKFFRRDDAVLDEVLVSGNTFENNSSDGLDFFAINTTEDLIDFTVNDNDITNNGELGIRLRVQADARIQANMTNNVIDMNGEFGADDANRGGIRVEGIQQVDLLMDLRDNQITNNFGDGIRTIGINGITPAVVDITGIWENNVVSFNQGDGFDQDNIVHGDYVWINNEFNNNGGQDGGHGASIRGAAEISIVGLANTFNFNQLNGLDLGGGFRGENSLWPYADAPFNSVPDVVDGIYFGDGTAPNEHEFIGNGLDGILIQGGGVGFVVDRVRIENNGEDGLDFELTGSTDIAFTDAVIYQNGGDGVEFFGRSGVNNNVSFFESSITFNTGRGIDILNTAPAASTSLSDVRLEGSEVKSNGLSGIFVVNTADNTQEQNGPQDVPLRSNGNIEAAPYLNLHILDNDIESNGNLDTLGGLVIWVGTTQAFLNIHLFPFFHDSAIATQLAASKIRSEVIANRFSGNFGTDVYISPFISTVDVPRSTGGWDESLDPDYQPNRVWTDPNSRIDMAFRGNTGDSLDVTNGTVFYNSPEEVFSSRDRTQDPIGPFTSGTRGRDALRTVGTIGGYPLAFPGVGTSTWRVESDYEPVPGDPVTGDQFTFIGPQFGFSNFETGIWDRTLPPNSIFSPQPDRFEDNDDPANATALDNTNGFGRTVGTAATGGLTIDAVGDDDFYRFIPAETGAITVEVLFNHDLGNLDIEIIEEATMTVIATRDSTTDNEIINPITDPGQVIVNEGEAYLLRVFGDVTFNYSFDITLPIIEDSFEDNDESSAPVDLGWVGDISIPDLNIDKAGDHDFWLVRAAGDPLTVDVTFTHNLGDIDVDVYRLNGDGSLTLLGSGNSGTDNEQVVVGTNFGENIIIDVYATGIDVQGDYQLDISAPIEADGREVNNTFGTAFNLDDPYGDPDDGDRVDAFVEGGLNLHVSGDEDYYVFTAQNSGDHTATITFDPAQGDLDFEILSSTGAQLDGSTGGGAFESVTANLARDSTYVLHVFSPTGDTSPGYTLHFGPVADDRFEQNDTQGTAANLGGLGQTEPSHVIERDLTFNDDDYYDVTVNEDGRFEARVDHINAMGNLDLRVLDQAGNVLATSITNNDKEVVAVSNAVAGTTFTVHVFSNNGATNYEYALEVQLSDPATGDAGGGGAGGGGGTDGGGGADNGSGGDSGGGTANGGGGASPWTVTSSLDEVDGDLSDGDALSANGNVTLRAAVQQANFDAGEDTIILPAGTYSLFLNGANENQSLTGDLDLTSDIIIRGAGADQTFIDASDLLLLDRVLHIGFAANVTLQDLTITGGDGVNGGGILNEGTLTLLNVDIVNNRAITEGGAIDNLGTLNISGGSIGNNTSTGPGGAIHNTGTITIANADISNNAAVGAGGAIYNTAGSTIDVAASTFTNNTSTADGGAILNAGVLSVNTTVFDGNDTISRGGAIANSNVLNVATSRFTGNHASSRGGAIYSTSSATIYGTTIDANTAYSRGGGIQVESGLVALLNSTLSGNHAAEGGGAYAEGSLDLTNVTVALNTADLNGGGLHAGAGVTTLINTIVATNTTVVSGNDVFETFLSQGSNLIGDATGGSGFTGLDQIGSSGAPIDAQLEPLANNQNPQNSTPAFILTHAIPETSPAIDAGNNTVRPQLTTYFDPPLDQTNSARFIDGNIDSVHTIDVGAFEYFVYIPVADLTGTPNPAAPLENIVFDASGSFHTNQDAVLTFTWDLDEDGQFDDAFGETINHSFTQFSKTQPDGVYTVRVLVTDDANPANTSIASVDIVVDQGNRAPVSQPGGPYQIDFGNDLQLDGSASTDPDLVFGDEIVTYAWDLDGDLLYDDAFGVSPVVSWTTLVSLGLSPGVHSIGLRVVDCFGVATDAPAIVDIVRVDFGDAPDSYDTLLGSGGPVHVIVDGIHLGSNVDGEQEAFAGPDALGDDTVDLDDEDGVTFSLFEADDLLPVAAQFTVNASTAGKIDAWVDFNGNGVFDHPSEHLNGGTSFDVVAGENVLSTTIPPGSSVGTTFARVRFSTAGGLTPLGRAADGEVEDHQLEITALQDPVTPTMLRPNSPAGDPVTTDLTPLFQWTAEPENFTYRLIVQTPTNPPVVVIDAMDLQSTIFIPATGLPVGQYEAFITAFNRAGEASPISAPWPFEIVRMNVSVRDTSTGGVDGAIPFTDDATPEFVWTDVPGTSRYDLQVDSLTTGERVISEPNLPGSSNTYIDPRILDLGTYSVTVRAYDSDGQPGDLSERYVFRVSTPPTVLTPVGDFFEDPLNDVFLPEFTWTEVPGALTYELVVDNDTTGERRVIDEVDLLTASFIPTEPLPVGQYTTRVRGVNVAGEVSNWSALQTFRVTTSPVITGPTGILVNSANDGSALRVIVADATPTFSWTEIEVADFYEITIRSLDANSGFADINERNLTSTTYTPTDEMPMGRYRVWVRARIGDGSDLTTQWSLKYDFDIGPAPVLEGPDFVTYNGLPEFSWTAPLGADSYELRVDDLSNDLDKIICAEDDPSNSDCRTNLITNTFTPTSDDILTGDELPIGRYRYWVRAITDEGLVGVWSVPRTFSVVTRPEITSPLSASGSARIDDATPTISWDAAPGAVNYQMWVRDLSRGIDQVLRVNTIASTSYTIPNDLPLGRYQVWVRGENAAGEFSAWSQPSNFSVAEAPQLLGPTGTSFDRIPTIDWTDVTGASRYEVWVNNVETGQRQIIHEENVTSSSLASPITLPDGEYHAWVRAFNEFGEFSFWSDKIVFNVGGRPIVDAIGDDEGVTNDTTPTIFWPGVGQANRYELQINDLETNTRIILETELTANSYTPAPLPEGDYRVWVRAISSTGEISKWSLPVDFTIDLAAAAPVAPESELSVPGEDIEVPVMAFAAFTTEAVIDPAETESTDPVLVAQLAERMGDSAELIPQEEFNYPDEFVDSAVPGLDLFPTEQNPEAPAVDDVLTEWPDLWVDDALATTTADDTVTVEPAVASGLAALGILPAMRRWRKRRNRRSDLN